MRKIFSILVLVVAMLAGGAGIAQASAPGDSFVDIDGTAYYVGVHTICLTAPETCVIAEDGSMVGPEFYSNFPAPVEVEVEVAVPVAAEVIPVAAPVPAVVYSMVTVDAAAAWVLWDAVGAAELLPAEGGTVTLLGGWDGSALGSSQIAIWDLAGNAYLFQIG